MTFDLRWKAACGLLVTASAFHPTTLTYWRRRLAGSAEPNRIFDAVKAVVTETGGAAREDAAGVGSTILDDAVATQDTVTQLIAAIRRVRREVPGAAEMIAAHCTAQRLRRPETVDRVERQGRPGTVIDALAGESQTVVAE